MALLFQENNVDSTHGMYHAMKIGNLTWRSLEEEDSLPNSVKEDILIASYLHDVDDRKYFPLNYKLNNARLLLQTIQI